MKYISNVPCPLRRRRGCKKIHMSLHSLLLPSFLPLTHHQATFFNPNYLFPSFSQFHCHSWRQSSTSPQVACCMSCASFNWRDCLLMLLTMSQGSHLCSLSSSPFLSFSLSLSRIIKQQRKKSTQSEMKSCRCSHYALVVVIAMIVFMQRWQCPLYEFSSPARKYVGNDSGVHRSLIMNSQVFIRFQ